MASSLNGNYKEDSDVFDNVSRALRICSSQGLQVEVLTTALIYLKENPDSTIEKALMVGLDVWHAD